MKASRYWHKEVQDVRCGNKVYSMISWGSSQSGLGEARQNALAKLAGWAKRIAAGQSISQYEYLSREIREEFLGELLDAKGNVLTATTRNRYGAQVLNSAGVMIADIDVPPPGTFEKLSSLFGKKANRNRDSRLGRIRSVAANNPKLAFHVYETFAGFRVFVLGRNFSPASEESSRMLTELGSDPLYQSLCRRQECYRARLTPKPWRCGCPTPPGTFPRQTPQMQDAFAKWLTRYEDRCRTLDVCRRVEIIGKATISEDQQKVLDMHDRVTINGGGKLA